MPEMEYFYGAPSLVDLVINEDRTVHQLADV